MVQEIRYHKTINEALEKESKRSEKKCYFSAKSTADQHEKVCIVIIMTKNKETMNRISRTRSVRLQSTKHSRCYNLCFLLFLVVWINWMDGISGGGDGNRRQFCTQHSAGGVYVFRTSLQKVFFINIFTQSSQESHQSTAVAETVSDGGDDDYTTNGGSRTYERRHKT